MAPLAVAATALLEARNLHKRFGGVRAVQDISLAVPDGGILAVIGPNGAGKSTLLNLLSGIYQPDAGTLELGGRGVVGMPSWARVRLGLARTFQKIRLFRNLSLIENVLVGFHIHHRVPAWQYLLPGAALRADRERCLARARELLAMVGLEARADDRAGALAYGQQRMLEIARALATDPRLFMLDEPAAGLNAAEVDFLLQRLAELARARHHGGGRRAQHGPRDERRRPRVRHGSRRVPVRGDAAGGAVQSARDRGLSRRRVRVKLLEAEGLELAYGEVAACRDISFFVEEGEIVALIGSNGAGKSTTMRAVAGAMLPRAGRISFAGTDITRMPAHERTGLGIALVPEGRRVFPALTVRENLEMGGYKFRADKTRVARLVEAMMDMFPRLRERAASAAARSRAASSRCSRSGAR